MYYDYLHLSSPPNGRPLIDLINEKALEGFRVVTFSVTDGGFEEALMERPSAKTVPEAEASDTAKPLSA